MAFEFDEKKLKALLALLRRASKCRYGSVFLTNRILMQCYSIDVDDDVGMHYTLFVPDTDEYDSEFYNIQIELVPNDIIKAYNAGHKALLEIRKDKGLKPKDVSESLLVYSKDVGDHPEMVFKFQYYVEESLSHVSEYQTQYPLDFSRPDVENCAYSIDILADRIKPGGYCMQLDALQLGIFQRAMDCPSIYQHIVKINGTKVRIPFMRSMFLGAKRYDKFVVTVQESVYPGIYVYCMMFERNALCECFYGYLQNY